MLQVATDESRQATNSEDFVGANRGMVRVVNFLDALGAKFGDTPRIGVSWQERAL